MVAAESSQNPRQRRCRNDSAKHYDAERKDLQLEEVWAVLQTYGDYDGGINCSICGKLYKSRVCFIKHLWEHTIYWDLFAGDKNHMRVLSIQAALILYGASRQSLRQPVTVDSLLVTSPHCQEHNVKEAKDSVINDVTSTFHSEETLGFVTSSTDVVSGVPESSTNRSSIMITDVLAVRNTFVQNQSAPSCNSLSQSLHISDCNSFSQHPPTTPVKPRKIQSIPSTPLKRHPGSFSKMSRKLLKKGRHLDSGSRVSLGQSPNPVRAGRFFVPSTDRNTDELYWKEADTSPYKRKSCGFPTLDHHNVQLCSQGRIMVPHPNPNHEEYDIY